MKCDSCNSPTSVIDSRMLANGSKIRRRRVCDGCNRRFSTYEYRDSNETQDKLQIAQDYINSLVREIESIKLKMLRTERPASIKKENVWKI